MAIKKVLLTKKVNNVIYDIFPKTSADVVVYGETTVSEALAEFTAMLNDVYAKSETDSAIKAESTALYNKIMGITEEDGATVTEAYDTLKEVAAWIEEHGDVAAAFTNDIAALKTAVGDENSGLVKAMADANAAITSNDEDIAALQKSVSDLETAYKAADATLQAAIDALADRVTTLETTVGGAESGLVKDMADAQTSISDLKTKVDSLIEVGGTKVEASETNGNIKVDGVELTVYTHPATHSADEIVTTDDKQFVTAAEKATIASAAAIRLVSSQDEVTNENDLYLVEIE